MASRLALLALLLVLSMAHLGARGMGHAPTAADARVAGAPWATQRADAARTGVHHVLWNGALWLLGLGLAVTLAGERAEPRSSRAAGGCSPLRPRQKAA